MAETKQLSKWTSHLCSWIKLAPMVAEPLEKGVIQFSVIFAVKDREGLKKDRLEDVEDDEEKNEEEGKEVQGRNNSLPAVGKVGSTIRGLYCSVPHELVPIFSS